MTPIRTIHYQTDLKVRLTKMLSFWILLFQFVVKQLIIMIMFLRIYTLVTYLIFEDYFFLIFIRNINNDTYFTPYT